MSTSTDVVWLGFIGSLLAGLGTALGAAGVFAIKRLTPRLEDGLLSFSAGIMLAASFFSLLLPAIEYGELQYENGNLAVIIVIFGFLCGAVALYLIHNHVPHEHFLTGREGPEAGALRRIWLFVIAITLHNFPEGMAVGVGFAGGDVKNGTALATGIGIQNILEGLAVSVSLITAGYSRREAFSVGSLTGLVEPVGGILGALAVSVAAPLMPWTLAFAAGAMLFIISDEIIPETHRRGFENLATFSLFIGFACMMYLDATLG